MTILIIIILVAYILYLHYSFAKKIQLADTLFAALLAASSNNRYAAAARFIDSLAHLLPHNQYDRMLARLCSAQGLPYWTDSEGYLIDNGLKSELAAELAARGEALANRLRASQGK